MSLEEKIHSILLKLPELEAELSHSSAFNDQKKYRALTEEHSFVSNVKRNFDDYNRYVKEEKDAIALLKEERDPEFRVVLEEELEVLQRNKEEAQSNLKQLLVPQDPADHKNTIVEIRAGTGGDEAALFVGDCVRMYKFFADKMGWQWEHLSSTASEIGGFKEYVMVFSGRNVYRFLKHEGGTHRVQRIPDTEAQGRVHTSAITIAVLLEPDEDVEVDINEKDLRVDTYRSSGAGGQHVNTTDSAVRLTHMPTGIVVYCQEERSQHKNKEKAMRLLKARIQAVQEREKLEAIKDARSSQVGSGDRSERIRTYNFPQNRLTDHRINLTKHNLDQVMNGELLEVVEALVLFYQGDNENGL